MARHISIHIGEYYGSAQPTVIKTIVGSCVAVCLFDPLKKIGAMNHILLPGRADMALFDAPARFGINAMELIVNKMLNLGADRSRLLAKAFGGANVLSGISSDKSPGRKISNSVQNFLETESIPMTASDLGGTQGRHVHFHTHTGDVYVKKISSPQMEEILMKEKTFRTTPGSK